MKQQQRTDYGLPTSGDCNANATVVSAVRGQDSRVPIVPRIVVVGCSGHARVVVDILEEENRSQIVGLLDTYKAPGTEALGYLVLGTSDDLPALVSANICDSAIVAIGDNWIRSHMVQRVRELVPEIGFVAAIHPSARIARDVLIGSGTVIMAGAVVNTGCQIGEFCILNTCSSLDHDSTMERFSSLAPRAVTGGGVRIGAFSAVCIGAVISHSIRIGEHTVVGAGATVLRNVPDRVVAFGTPARAIRERNPGDSYLSERPHNETTLPRPLQVPGFADSRNSLKLISSTSAEWRSYLQCTAHDFFHTAEYHQVAETLGSGKPCLAVYGNARKFVAWPYLLQNIEGLEYASASKLYNVTSVYGYAGPLTCGGDHDEAFLTSAWGAMVEAWRSQSVVSVFTRFHPLLANHRWVPYIRNDRKTLELADDEGQEKTVAINLSGSEAEAWSSYKRQLRQALRRLWGFGMITTPDPEWRYLDDFVRLYYTTMKRNNAAPFYLFPGNHFRKLKEALGSHGTLMVTRYADKVIAAALLIEYAGIVNVHLLASDHRFANLSPSKLIIHQAQIWARTRGNRYLHLGGGRGSRSDDALFRFKASFSDAFYPFYTGRWILDEKAYDALTVERQNQSRRLCRKMDGTYFPAYRARFQIVDAAEELREESTPDENPKSECENQEAANGRQQPTTSE